jgi:MoaD family protein
LLVTFKSFGPLRRVIEQPTIGLEVPSQSTVRTVIDVVVARWGTRAEQLIMEGNHVSGNLIIMLNMQDVDSLAGEATPVKEGDEITLLPHVQGG